MLDEAQVLAGLFPYPRLMLSHGEGSWVWDEAGQRYLDFTAGLGVLALGHGRHDLAQVAQAQFARLAHCSNLFGNRPQVLLATRLKEMADFTARVWFANSGAEANEAALKFARLVGRQRGGAAKHHFIGLERGFHGRTLGALAVTHTPEYRAPFAPELPGARFARFNDLESVRAVMDDDVCAVVVEPVQGEGGVHPATAAFLHGLRALCDAHGALLVCDEVQCGLGRVGSLFAYQYFRVRPDMVCLAKPLAGGLPLGAVLLNDAVASVLRPGQHGSTFAGGPVACAVANAVLEVICAPGFLTTVRQRAAQLEAVLQEVVAAGPVFVARRGLGLMQALVIGAPHQDAPADLLMQARQRGLLVTRAGPDALRLLPPLTCSADEITWAGAVLRQLAVRRP